MRLKIERKTAMVGAPLSGEPPIKMSKGWGRMGSEAFSGHSDGPGGRAWSRDGVLRGAVSCPSPSRCYPSPSANELRRVMVGEQGSGRRTDMEGRKIIGAMVSMNKQSTGARDRGRAKDPSRQAHRRPQYSDSSAEPHPVVRNLLFLPCLSPDVTLAHRSHPFLPRLPRHPTPKLEALESAHPLDCPLPLDDRLLATGTLSQEQKSSLRKPMMRTRSLASPSARPSLTRPACHISSSIRFCADPINTPLRSRSPSCSKARSKRSSTPSPTPTARATP